MAYQPIPRPVLGHLSFLGAGTLPIALDDDGRAHIVLAVRLKESIEVDFAIITEAASLLAASTRPILFQFVANGDVDDGGEELVFASLDPQSALEGAVGNGLQVLTNGEELVGRYVPTASERSVAVPMQGSDQFGQPFPEDLTGYLTARAIDPVMGGGIPPQNGRALARVEFREVELTDEGEPLARGFSDGFSR